MTDKELREIVGDSFMDALDEMDKAIQNLRDFNKTLEIPKENIMAEPSPNHVETRTLSVVICTRCIKPFTQEDFYPHPCVENGPNRWEELRKWVDKMIGVTALPNNPYDRGLHRSFLTISAKLSQLEKDEK